MKKPKLDFYHLSIAQKIQKGREVITHMTGNTNFTTPNPTLAVITAAINGLETASEAAADGGKALKANMRAKEKILNDLMVQLEEYISNVCAGDEQKILSSGMGVKQIKPHGKRNDSVMAGLNPGEVICTASAPGRGITATHEFHRCNDPVPADSQAETTNPWVPAEISTLSTVTISNLTPGVKMWFRHRLILTKGKKEPWSLLGSVIVPK